MILPLLLWPEGPFKPHKALSQDQNWPVQCLFLLLSLLPLPQQSAFIKHLLCAKHCHTYSSAQPVKLAVGEDASIIIHSIDKETGFR